MTVGNLIEELNKYDKDDRIMCLNVKADYGHYSLDILGTETSSMGGRCISIITKEI